MATITMNIETIANWSQAQRVETRLGPRMVRSAVPHDAFWDAWRSHKDALKSAGISCSKDPRGNWQACWWLPLSEAEQVKEAAAIADSQAASCDNFHVPMPAGMELLPYQIAGVKYASQRDRCLIADQMGLGKTPQSIGVLNLIEVPKFVVVVCPASLKINWERELKRFCIHELEIIRCSGRKPKPAVEQQINDATKCVVLIINYDILSGWRPFIDARQVDLVICDEAHYAKNEKAARTKATLGLQARKILWLTGTPAENRPVELWTACKIMDPEGLGKSFMKFAYRYCDARDNGYGFDFSGHSNSEELARRLRTNFMVRRLKSDVLTELPAKRHQIVPMELDSKIGTGQDWSNIEALRVKAEMALVADDDAAYLAAIEELNGSIRIAFEEAAAVRSELAEKKLPKVIEHLEMLLENGDPIVVFGHHRSMVDGIADYFGDRAVRVHGDVSMAARQEAVDKFQSGKADIFVGNFRAAGVGITLTRASLVVLAELDYVPGVVEQAIDRCHRIGQVNSVLAQYLVVDNSIDSYMAQMIIDKQAILSATLDGQQEQAIVKPEVVTELVVEEKEAPKIPARRQAIVDLAERITDEQVGRVYQALQILSGLCDGAREIDGCGFNKFDSTIGKSMALQTSLSKKQAAYAWGMCRKYKRQLPVGLLEF